ncbi:MAG: sporulation protein YunB [Clostridia bacterium]|nr:sporulation protein YunB [Clostridia bacterium]
MKKIKRRVGVILLTLFFLLLLFIYSFNKLMPIVNAHAVQYSRSYATRVISESVKAVIEEKGTQYTDLVTLNSDTEGNVLSLSSNIVNINKMKSEVSLRILSVLSDDERRLLKIPIGNLTGMYLLSGRGFRLSIRLIPTDSVITSFESSFTEVGINQSWHRITMKITVKLGVIILGEHNTVEVTDSVVIADTVIVGRVPDAYTHIEDLDDETVGEIIDFKAG